MMLVGEFFCFVLYVCLCIVFLKGDGGGRVRRSVYLVVGCLVLILLCAHMSWSVSLCISPLLIKLVMAFISPCHYQSFIWDRRMVSHV